MKFSLFTVIIFKRTGLRNKHSPNYFAYNCPIQYCVLYLPEKDILKLSVNRLWMKADSAGSCVLSVTHLRVLCRSPEKCDLATSNFFFSQTRKVNNEYFKVEKRLTNVAKIITVTHEHPIYLQDSTMGKTNENNKIATNERKIN